MGFCALWIGLEDSYRVVGYALEANFTDNSAGVGSFYYVISATNNAGEGVDSAPLNFSAVLK